MRTSFYFVIYLVIYFVIYLVRHWVNNYLLLATGRKSADSADNLKLPQCST